MEELIEDKQGERIILGGQVDPLAPKEHKPAEKVREPQSNKPTFLSHDRIKRYEVDSLDDAVGLSHETIASVVPAESIDAFHDDVTDVLHSIFGEELSRMLKKEPRTETVAAYDNDPGKLHATVAWREDLAGRKGVRGDYSDNFTCREIEVDYDAPEGSEDPDNERVYKVTVRYLDEDTDSKDTYRIEFSMVFDPNDLKKATDCYFDWANVYLHNKKATPYSHFNSDGFLVDPANADLPQKMEGREQVLADEPAAIDIQKTMKTWVEQKPMLVVKG
jgi:hypothetical protein